jgi:hypothetical protein
MNTTNKHSTIKQNTLQMNNTMNKHSTIKQNTLQMNNTMNKLSTIKRYTPRMNKSFGVSSDDLFTTRLNPSYRFTDRSGVLFPWVKSFFIHDAKLTERPILLLSGNDSVRREAALMRAGRYFELLQSWKYMVPEETVLPVTIIECGEDCDAIIRDDKDELEDMGILDCCYFQKCTLYTDDFCLIMRDIHLIPSTQGFSFYRFLLSRLGKTVKSTRKPLIINDSRGVNGLQKQFQKEWHNISPILEQHSIQLEL